MELFERFWIIVPLVRPMFAELVGEELENDSTRRDVVVRALYSW